VKYNKCKKNAIQKRPNMLQEDICFGLSAFWEGHFYTLQQMLMCEAAGPTEEQLTTWDCLGIFLVTTSLILFLFSFLNHQSKKKLCQNQTVNVFPTPTRTALFPPGKNTGISG